jgi:hypothetical protein
MARTILSRSGRLSRCRDFFAVGVTTRRHRTGSVSEQLLPDVVPGDHLAVVGLVARLGGGGVLFRRDGLVLPGTSVAAGETGVVRTLEEDGHRVERLLGKGVDEAVEVSSGHLVTVPPARAE